VGRPRLARELLITTNLLAAVLVGSIPLAYALDALSVTHLYAMSFGFGLLAAFWSPAWHAFLPSVVKPGMLVEANAKMMLMFSTSGITGPASEACSSPSSQHRSSWCSTPSRSSPPPCSCAASTRVRGRTSTAGARTACGRGS
jgi:hypothetical protein